MRNWCLSLVDSREMCRYSTFREINYFLKALFCVLQTNRSKSIFSLSLSIGLCGIVLIIVDLGGRGEQPGVCCLVVTLSLRTGVATL